MQGNSGNRTDRRHVGKRPDGTFIAGGAFRATVRLSDAELQSLHDRNTRHGFMADGAGHGPALRHALHGADNVLAWIRSDPDLHDSLRFQIALLLDEPELAADIVVGLLDQVIGLPVLGATEEDLGAIVALLVKEGSVQVEGEHCVPSTLKLVAEATQPGGPAWARLARIRSSWRPA